MKKTKSIVTRDQISNRELKFVSFQKEIMYKKIVLLPKVLIEESTVKIHGNVRRIESLSIMESFIFDVRKDIE